MPIICWGNLAKSADDTKRIEQAISEYVEDHNFNPNAHQVEGSSLYMHRVNEELDHLQESVKNYHIANQFRVYKAVVDINGNGDYTNIQEAINYVNGLGGGTVFVKAGTYLFSDNLNLYSNIELKGEDDETTILNFQGNAKGIRIIGTSGSHKKNVAISDLQVRNSRGDDTGAIYAIYTDDLIIERCKFYNSRQYSGDAFSDIYCDLCSDIEVKECKFIDSLSCITGGSTERWHIENNYIYNSLSCAINLGTSGDHCLITKNFFETCDDVCINITGSRMGFHIFNNTAINIASSFCWGEETTQVQIIGNYVDGHNNSYSMIVLDSGNNNVVVGNILINAATGIYVTKSDRNIVVGNISINHSSRGIYIADSQCDRNLVVGNVCYNNSVANITDSGTNTELAHNVVA